MAIKRKIVPLTTSEAARIKVPVVYALSDDAGVFYVGRTTRPDCRFAHHAGAYTTNRDLRARLLRAGQRLRVRILQVDPADIALSEQQEIARRRGLLNLHLNGRAQSRQFNSSRPWIVPGRVSPGTWAARCTGLHRHEQFQATLQAMSPAQRCAYEVGLYSELPAFRQGTFAPWLEAARAPMLACMEAWDGR